MSGLPTRIPAFCKLQGTKVLCDHARPVGGRDQIVACRTSGAGFSFWAAKKVLVSRNGMDGGTGATRYTPLALPLTARASGET